MNSTVETKWYDKNWLVILLCVVFFPVGLYALWKSNTFSKGWKIAITVVLSLIILGQINKELDKESIQSGAKNEQITQENQNETNTSNEVPTTDNGIQYLEPTDVNVDKSLIGQEVNVKGYFKTFAQWKYLYDEAGSPNFIQLNIDNLPKESQKYLFKECNDGCDLKFKGIVKNNYGTIILQVTAIL